MFLQDKLKKLDINESLACLKSIESNITDEEKFIQIMKSVEVPKWVIDELERLSSF